MAEDEHDQFACFVVIVDDENLEAVQLRHLRLRAELLQLGRLHAHGQQRQRDRESRAVAEAFAFDAYLAAVQRDEVTYGRNSGLIPWPLSLTRRIALLSEHFNSRRTRPPSGVNLIAFDNRFQIT